MKVMDMDYSINSFLTHFLAAFPTFIGGSQSGEFLQDQINLPQSINGVDKKQNEISFSLCSDTFNTQNYKWFCRQPCRDNDRMHDR